MLGKNIGFGPDATHTKEVPDELCSETYEMEFLMQIPSRIENNEKFHKQMIKLLVKISNLSNVLLQENRVLH